MIDAPEIFWAVIVSMYIGNLILLILNLPLIPYDGIAFIWERPMTLGLLLIALILVILPSIRDRRARNRSSRAGNGD